MLPVGEKPFDTVVEGADAGRQPELHRRLERHLRVVDDGVGEQARVAHAALGPGLVGEACAGSKLGHRQGRRDRNVGQGSLGVSAMFGDPDREDLRGVDGAAAAEADDAVHISPFGVVYRRLDLLKWRVLADEDG